MSNENEMDQVKVQEALAGIKTQVQEMATKALSEQEKTGKLSEETKTAVDEVLTKQGEFQARLAGIEQELVKGRDMGEEPQLTAGEAFVKGINDNPALKAMLDRPQIGQSVVVDIDRKALTYTGVTGAAIAYPGDQVRGILPPLVRRLTIRDLLAAGRTGQNALFYPRESGFTNNAAPVSEGSLKPESDITIEIITEAVKTIANTLRVSKQMYDDQPALISYVNGRLMYGLKLVEEAQLLNGSGTGQNLSGIYTEATAYSNVNSLPNEQDLDKIRLAMLQVEIAYAETTGIVLNPTDWAKMELLKDSTGQYLFARPQESAVPRLWGRPVVSTQAMAQGRFLVGDFAQHAQIFDREDTNVAISWEDRDNFVRNMATIRVEERLALAIYRPEAFVKGRLESATGPGL